MAESKNVIQILNNPALIVILTWMQWMVMMMMTFTIEEELLFTWRFYDLPDARYDSWLKLNHPDAEVVMVPDSACVSPLFSDPNSSFDSCEENPLNISDGTSYVVYSGFTPSTTGPSASSSRPNNAASTPLTTGPSASSGCLNNAASTPPSTILQLSH